MAEAAKTAISAGGYDKVIAPATSFGKEVVPMVGGLLDVQPISDVI